MIEIHELDIPSCCPVTKNPQPGSVLKIKYRPKRVILEVEYLEIYIREYVGGRLDVRSMEGMVQNIAQDCARTLGVKVKVTAKLILLPKQKMKLQCTAWP
jgi:NADPH-dependent 7-cyano-7-deazaguanine reductase QueF